jgi:hypothetical protein
MRRSLMILLGFLVIGTIPSASAQEASTSENISWVALLVAITSVGGVVTGFILNWSSLKVQNKNLEIQNKNLEIQNESLKVQNTRLNTQNENNKITLLTSLAHDMSNEIEKESKLSTELECVLYVITYLDNLSRIAMLFEKGHLPADMGEYFRAFFSYGLTLEEFYKVIAPKRHAQIAGNQRWKRIQDWCDHESIIKMGDDTLPLVMQQLKNKIHTQ